MLGLVYEPEEASCPSCSSIVQAGAVRRQRCLDFTSVAPRATPGTGTDKQHWAAGVRQRGYGAALQGYVSIGAAQPLRPPSIANVCEVTIALSSAAR
jgi:hypothetical protein